MLNTQLNGLEKFVASGQLQEMKPREVAGRLGVSIWSVRNIVMQLRTKLQTESIAELVAEFNREEKLKADILKLPIARGRKQSSEVLNLLSNRSPKSDA